VTDLQTNMTDVFMINNATLIIEAIEELEVIVENM